jgi:hypothetical protein
MHYGGDTNVKEVYEDEENSDGDEVAKPDYL